MLVTTQIALYALAQLVRLLLRKQRNAEESETVENERPCLSSSVPSKEAPKHVSPDQTGVPSHSLTTTASATERAPEQKSVADRVSSTSPRRETTRTTQPVERTKIEKQMSNEKEMSRGMSSSGKTLEQKMGDQVHMSPSGLGRGHRIPRSAKSSEEKLGGEQVHTTHSNIGQGPRTPQTGKSSEQKLGEQVRLGPSGLGRGQRTLQSGKSLEQKLGGESVRATSDVGQSHRTLQSGKSSEQTLREEQLHASPSGFGRGHRIPQPGKSSEQKQGSEQVHSSRHGLGRGYRTPQSVVPPGNQGRMEPSPMVSSGLGRGMRPATPAQSSPRTQKGSAATPPAPAPAPPAASLPADWENIKSSNPNVSSDWLLQMLNKPLESQNDCTAYNRYLVDLESRWHSENVKDKVTHHAEVVRVYRSYLSNVQNPFHFVAFLLPQARGFGAGKTTSLAFFVIKEFEKWCSEKRQSQPNWDAELLSEELRLNVFLLVTRKHLTFLSLTVSAFNLKHPGNEYFLPILKQFQEEKKYKEAAVCTAELGLQDNFDLEQIVLPLILQDKVNLVETYVRGRPDLQRQLVQLLDRYTDRSFDMNDLAQTSGVANIRYDKLNKRILSKMALRLLKMYDVPSDLCPNITNSRGLGAVRYLLYKRYIEKSMGSGSWDEMIQSAVGESQFLQIQLTELLACYELEEAVKWANFYKLEDSVLLDSIVDARHSSNSERERREEGAGFTEENWDENNTAAAGAQSDLYLTLTLDPDCVTLVESPEQWEQCLQHVCVPGNIVGYDSEWKAGFQGFPSRVSLVQLAVKDRVYLLDILSLENCLSEEQWTQLAVQLFCSCDVVKLGYGIEGDLQMLVRTLPVLKEPMLAATRCVDIHPLGKKVFGQATVEEEEGEWDGETETMTAKREERGLSELVRKCLGKPLCKQEQMSDWERRPLRPAQITYAALDAYVLLDVYARLRQLVEEQQLSIELEPPLSLRWAKPSKNQKKKARLSGNLLPSPPKVENMPMRDGSPIKPGDLRLVVDTMLQGLGRRLRNLGVDVHVLENNDDHMQCAEVSLKENRIILTSGTPFPMLRSRVGRDMCYCVTESSAREQVLEVITHFNVQTREEDIFSRCRLCNGDGFATLSCADARKLRSWVLQEAQPSEAERQHFLLDFGIDPQTGFLEPCSGGGEKKSGWNHVRIQIEKVHETILERDTEIFICQSCGKVYWIGSHLPKVMETFAEILPGGSSTARSICSELKDSEGDS